MMSEWKEYKTEQIAEISTGYAFKGNEYEFNGNLRVVRGENVTIGNLRWDSEKFWNKTTKGLEQYYLKKDDIVIGMDGSRVGNNRAKIKEKELPLILAQRVARLRAKPNFDQNFLWFHIFSNSFKDYVEAIHTGTSIPHISQRQIGDFEIFAPISKSEQRIIASILTSLDDKIDLLHRQNKTLEQMAETLFRQWFVVEAKEGWETIKISDVASINKSSIGKNYSFNEIEYLDTGSITRGQIESFQNYLLKEAPSRAQRLVTKNDIVYSLVRPIQRHFGFLQEAKPNTVVSTGFCVVSCEKISPYFIYILLTLDETVEYFDMVAEGATSAYPSLKPSDIANLEFQSPPKFLLAEFSEIAENSWNKIKSNTAQIRTLMAMRDSLLPKLMSGEVRVEEAM